MTKLDKFISLDGNKYRYNGIIDDTIKYIENFQLLNEELWLRFVQQFREDADYDGGWRGEYWGKMMRGACFVYSYTKNPRLYKVLETSVCDMMDSADASGRISSYGANHEFDAWDIWSRKYVLLGMQYFIEICDDNALCDNIINNMCKQVDYIMSKIGDEEGKLPITKATRHWRGLNSSSLLEPVVRLYNLTNDNKYFDFATYIVKSGGMDIANLFDLAYENKLYPYQYPATKAYEMTSCFEGLIEYYRITGDEYYKTAIINFADRVLESDFTIIGCSGCTHELFDHSAVRQANTTNGEIMQETCVTVTLMKFFYQLARLTGDSKYSDVFEISMYNAYLGAVNTEKVIEPKIKAENPTLNIEPLAFDSYSPLTAGTRGNGIGGFKIMSDNHYYGCCACIGAAGVGLIPKISVFSFVDGIALNMYIDGVINTITPGGNTLKLKTTTRYPVDGRINVVFEMNEEEEFEVCLRNPYWSKDTKLFVNNTAVKVNDGYICIKQQWKNRDSIELYLDMRTKALRPVSYGSQVLMNKVIWGENYMIPTYDEEDPIAKNHIALQRGPIILAQENRLGYNVDEPVDIVVDTNEYVDVTFPEIEVAPYKNIIEMCVPLSNGSYMHVTDYASAGKLWNEESKMAAWMLTNPQI